MSFGYFQPGEVHKVDPGHAEEIISLYISQLAWERFDTLLLITLLLITLLTLLLVPR